MTLGLVRLAADAIEDATLRPTSHVSEHALFHAYRAGEAPAPVVQCACGGQLAAATDPRAIAAAVQMHRESPGHRAWWARTEDEWQS